MVHTLEIHLLLAENSAIAKFARHEADFSLDTVSRECLGQIYSLENIRISLSYSRNKFCESSLHSQISQKFGPRIHNPLYGLDKVCKGYKKTFLYGSQNFRYFWNGGNQTRGSDRS